MTRRVVALALGIGTAASLVGGATGQSNWVPAQYTTYPAYPVYQTTYSAYACGTYNCNPYECVAPHLPDVRLGR